MRTSDQYHDFSHEKLWKLTQKDTCFEKFGITNFKITFWEWSDGDSNPRRVRLDIREGNSKTIWLPIVSHKSKTLPEELYEPRDIRVIS